ncbi:MAG: PIG-L family deacetylase [Rhizonema sp. NSF051]|nr:PIG-L family deacetylase [Rhizonema sp. NSF051]
MNNQVTATLPLSNPTALPLRSVKEIAQSKVLVVAPHPDDETLGCGGAIALLRFLGCDVRVLVMSDGTLSHPRSQKFPETVLRSLRESETLSALKILGVHASTVTFLGLKDGSVPILNSPLKSSAVAACRNYLAEIAPQTIFLPWRYDPHPDHRASWNLIYTALKEMSLSPRLIEYPIWDWDEEQQGTGVGAGEGDRESGSKFEENSPIPPQVIGWRLDIETVMELKNSAIAAYASQTTNLIDDDPEGFRLTPEMLLNFTRPWEVYLEVKTADSCC